MKLYSSFASSGGGSGRMIEGYNMNNFWATR